MKIPSTNILILSAICLSVVGGAGAYRIANYQKSAALASSQISSSLAVDQSTSTPPAAANTEILSVLQDAELQGIAATNTDPFAPLATDNLTDRLSKNLFTAYANEQYSNDTSGGISAANNPDAVTQDANNIIGSIDTSGLPQAPYSTSDLKLFSPKTADDLKNYGDQVASIQTNDLAVIAADPNTYNNDIGAIAKVYGKTGKDLLQMPVPVETAALHVEIANDFAISAASFNMISQQSKDPVKALLALKTFQEASVRQLEAEYQLAIYFRQNGILFSNTEVGNYWTQLAAEGVASSSSPNAAAGGQTTIQQ